MIETFDGTRRAPLLPSIDPSSSNAFGAVGQFLYSATGHLLFTRFDTNAGLWAIPFRRTIDPKQMFLVAPHVTSASAANDGTLMMRMGSDAGASYELIAVDRSSRASRVLVGSAAGVSSPKMSPDGRRVAMIINTGGQRQVWVQDIGSASGARLTFDDDDYAHPAWFPAGDRLLYSGHAQLINGTQIYAIGRDGSGVRKELAIAHRGQPSSDGKSVVYLVDERGDNHLRRGSVETRPTELERVFKSDPEPDVHDFALSPDGRLVAFVDYKGGRADLLVTRYPSAEGRWQVFGNGGRGMWNSDENLHWAHDTHELFFTVSGNDPEEARLMAATVRADSAGVTIEQPTVLFDIDADALAGGFDVSPDGKTFYFRRRATTQPKGTARRFMLIQNWAAEFERAR